MGSNARAIVTIVTISEGSRVCLFSVRLSRRLLYRTRRPRPRRVGAPKRPPGSLVPRTVQPDRLEIVSLLPNTPRVRHLRTVRAQRPRRLGRVRFLRRHLRRVARARANAEGERRAVGFAENRKSPSRKSSSGVPRSPFPVASHASVFRVVGDGVTEVRQVRSNLVRPVSGSHRTSAVFGWRFVESVPRDMARSGVVASLAPSRPALAGVEHVATRARSSYLISAVTVTYVDPLGGSRRTSTPSSGREYSDPEPSSSSVESLAKRTRAGRGRRRGIPYEPRVLPPVFAARSPPPRGAP